MLIAQAPLAPEIARLPRLAGTSPAVARINATLARVDDDVAAELAGLTGAYSFWERDTEVAFSGPWFLSLVEFNAYYRDGAAHPESFLRFLTFDLATGSEVDWRRLLPIQLASDLQRTRWGRYTGERLTTYFLAHVDPGTDGECLRVLEATRLAFDFSLEAATRSVVIHPNGAAHSEKACESAVAVGLEALRALDAATDLIRALDSAEP